MTIYKTTDIILAAVIRLEGYQLHNIEIRGNKGTFEFVDVPDELIRVYDLGSCSVEPVAFNGMVKQLTTSVRRLAQR